MSKRIEDLIEALLNGEAVAVTPRSRVEEYLKNCVDGTGTEGLERPRSRVEVLLWQLADKIAGGGVAVVDDTQMYMLRTPSGEEIPAVLVEEEVMFTATENDIREGAVAATDSGVTVGTKEIPPYYAISGKRIIPPGGTIDVPNFAKYEYTQFQALICKFNTSISDSVATDKVSIDGKVYAVNSTEPLSEVVLDDETKTINLSIVNDSETFYILRYFTLKEEF